VKLDRSKLRLILGIFLSLIVLAVLILTVDVRKVLDSLRLIDPVIVIPVLALILISLIIRAGAWRFILKERIPLQKSFFIINTGYFVNTILPFRIGEITRAFLLLPAGIEFWEALPTILLERIFDFGFTLSFFFIGLSFAAGFSQSPLLAYLVASLIVGSIIILFILVKNKKKVQSWISTTALIKPDLRDRLSRMVQAVYSSLEIINDPVRLGKIFILMFINWMIALTYQYILLKAFFPDAQFIWTVFMLGALGLGISIPSSPGNLGLYEASITLALAAFGVDHNLALAFALASHIISLLPTTLLGSYGLVQEGLALRDIWRLRETQKKEIGS
jgi:uncharacterized protein (TIRG00374 family)